MLDVNSNNVAGLTSRAEKVLRDFGQEVFRSIFVDVRGHFEHLCPEQGKGSASRA